MEDDGIDVGWGDRGVAVRKGYWEGEGRAAADAIFEALYPEETMRITH